MFKKPRVKIIKHLDDVTSEWCASGVIISVKNGKGILSHKYIENNDYSLDSALMFDDTPLVRGKYNVCSTCNGLLTSGYGIENVKNDELQKVRNAVNESFCGIKEAVSSLAPLLGLLRDGYYAVSDTVHYPTDGNGNFFYNIPNTLTEYDGSCDDYYLGGLFTTGATYPAFLIPTQSVSCINRERVDYYKKKLSEDPDSVRGIAFHEKGYFSALIDGHHKAFAAAELGLPIRCITIVPVTYYYTSGVPGTSDSRSGICFCDLNIDKSREIDTDNRPEKTCVNENSKEEALIKNPEFVSKTAGQSFDIPCKRYPTSYQLALKDGLFSGISDIDAEIEKRVQGYKEDAEDALWLEKAMELLVVIDPPRARMLALRLFDSPRMGVSPRSIWKTLSCFHDSDIEQMFIDFLINEEKTHCAYDIVNSYWDT